MAKTLTRDEINLVTARLKELGIWHTSSNSFKTAVRAFQRINDLKVDGIAGPNTWAKLFPPVDGQRADVPAGWLPPLHPATKWPAQRDCNEFFGAVGSNQTRCTLPYSLRIAWSKSQSLKSFECHMKVKEPIELIFTEIAKAYDKASIRELGLDLFGGCLNVRKMTGGSSWSMHAWGIAVDMDPSRNSYYSRREPSRPGHPHAKMADPEYDKYWQIVESTGAISLGRTRNIDWMHWQFARI